MWSKTCQLLIHGSACILAQNHRRLLTSPAPWGSHYPGETCSASGLGGLVQPLLRQIKVFLNADLSIACIDLLWLDVDGLLPLVVTADLPLKSTGHCSSLIDADVTLSLLELNLIKLVGGLLGGLVGAVDKIVGLSGLLDPTTHALVCLNIDLSLSGRRSWGRCSGSGLIDLNLDLSLLGNGLLDLSELCILNNAVSLLKFGNLL